MGPFRFRLDRVLEWYQKQLQLEQSRLAECHASLSRAQQALAELKLAREQVELALLHSPSMTAGDLAALEQFRYGARSNEKRLSDECHASQQKVGAQLEVVKLAQRKVRLLEKLRERRQTEHTYEVNRELEQLAADTYLAKFARER